MKKFSVIPVLICLLCLLGFSAASFGQNASYGVVPLTVGTSDVNIVANLTAQYVIIRENTDAPSAVFYVTLPGTTTALKYPAGSQIQIASPVNQPFKSGAIAGKIHASTAGPFSFVAVESAGPPSVSLSSGGGGGGGGGSGPNNTPVVTHFFLTGYSSIAGTFMSAQPAAADITGLAASATTDTTNAANISSGTLNHARLPVLLSADIPNNTANAGTATALAATPTQCGANNFAKGITAAGVANCAQPVEADITGLVSDLSAKAPSISPTFTSASLGTSYLSTTKTVGVGGVTANLLVKIDTTGNVANASVSDVGTLGIAAVTATSGNPVEVATRGIINCIADNTTVIGDAIIPGTVTGGRCRDSGQPNSTTVSLLTQVIGKALTVATVGNPVSVQLYGPGHYGSMAHPNASTNTFIAGPSAYGAAAAAPVARAVASEDIPSDFGQCAILDYSICTSAVDANGNPSYITQGSLGNRLSINGAGFVAYLQGKKQTGSGTYTDAITGLTSSTFNYVYLKQDLTNASLVGADFAATILAPVYSYIAPTLCTGAAAGAPQYWFDLSTRQWRVSTIAPCSFSVAAPQVLFLAATWVTATPTIAGVAHEPFSLSPYRRFEMFGDGFDAPNGGTVITKQEKTSGTTTIDHWHTYTSFQLTGATVSPTARAGSGATDGILAIWSQNPVLIVNTSALTANSLGSTNNAAGNGVGANTTAVGIMGAGGGGGGGTGNAGGAGGNRYPWYGPAASGGGTAGGAGSGAGGNASSTPTGSLPFCQATLVGIIGAPGGNGGGDGTHPGGTGGASGGGILIKAPTVIVDASSSITANGGNGANGGAGGNAGAGGAGGGGAVLVCGGNLSLLGTLTANAGSAGTASGTGGPGGAGTNGYVQKSKLW